jgi:hypothetical protein
MMGIERTQLEREKATKVSRRRRRRRRSRRIEGRECSGFLGYLSNSIQFIVFNTAPGHSNFY